MIIEDFWFVQSETVENDFGELEETLNIRCCVEGREVETLHDVANCTESESLEKLFRQQERIAFDETDRAYSISFVSQYGVSPEDAIDLTAALKFGIYGDLYDEDIDRQRLLSFKEFEKEGFGQLVNVLTDAGSGRGIALSSASDGKILVLTLEDIPFVDPFDGEEVVLPFAMLCRIRKNRLVAV
ncbi:MAG: hypothetical protein GJ680_18450 [Alteromonadaceae bacterium]|nr:hypothetical protein [Alteromonadaceae bacterium]